jgi:hypothetical protein
MLLLKHLPPLKRMVFLQSIVEHMYDQYGNTFEDIVSESIVIESSFGNRVRVFNAVWIAETWPVPVLKISGVCFSTIVNLLNGG